MARTVERIEKDLATLEENLGAIAQEFEETYTNYLRDLGEAVSRQLVLAVYQICTQEYPKSFLALSLQQRQDLQQAARHLARSGTEQLLALLKEQPEKQQPDTQDETPADNHPQIMVTAEEAPPEDSSELANSEEFEEEEFEEEDDDDDDDPSSLSSDSFLSSSEPEEIMMLLALAASAQKAQSNDVESDDALNRIVQWQQQVEKGIVGVLLRLSQGANRILHQAHILPHQIPEPVLEVATKTSMMTEPTPGSPNLINLVIEAKSEEAKSADVMRLVAIRLRLAEVEFANPTLSNWRSRLRAMNGRLSQVGKEYRKNQKERAIAQAELAWRSSWYED